MDALGRAFAGKRNTGTTRPFHLPTYELLRCHGACLFGINPNKITLDPKFSAAGVEVRFPMD